MRVWDTYVWGHVIDIKVLNSRLEDKRYSKVSPVSSLLVEVANRQMDNGWRRAWAHKGRSHK
jgi:hypothetical protein